MLFGGRSGEHEVSLASATSILQALDSEKYEAVPIGITRRGVWRIADSPQQLLQSEVTASLPGTDEAIPDVSHHGIVRARNGRLGAHDTAVDVVFPALHGTFGEDGTVQGLLKSADIPFVGSDVRSSANCMDKATMKVLFHSAGLAQVQYVIVRRRELEGRPDEEIGHIESVLEYPVFVKPCNLGSSVGISKARDRAELLESLRLAARYDTKLIVEQGIDAREVECGVLGNDEPIVSAFGEVESHHEWYDYDSKYTEGMADLVIPARLTSRQERTAREYALKAFETMECAGLARVDFFFGAPMGQC